MVFGCDNSAQKEFLNKRKVKGNIEGPGQSNSNLWFTDPALPDQLGPTTAAGAVWLEEAVEANAPSEPFLFAGWSRRTAWVKNEGLQAVQFTFETVRKGTGNWQKSNEVTVAAGADQRIAFAADVAGEWIRVRTNLPTTATVHFFFTGQDQRSQSDALFQGLSAVTETNSHGGLLYGLGDDRWALGVSAVHFSEGKAEPVGYYELDAALWLQSKSDATTLAFINEHFAIPEQVITVTSSSVLVVDDRGRRWRLPLGDTAFTSLTNQASLRVAREVATERDLLNCHGTFYELPAENADGFAKIRPISSHHFRVHNYASYRGLLVMTGLDHITGKRIRARCGIRGWQSGRVDRSD